MIRRLVCKIYFGFFLLIFKNPRLVKYAALGLLVVLPAAGLVYTKIYQHWDDDPDRGAIAIEAWGDGEGYQTPEYLNQGWDAADSLWYYNTTQGSALVPYDFLIALEQPELDGPPATRCGRNGSERPWFLCASNVDRMRYLPQKATFFNPDALPVGFVKESYKGKDYVGFTCAACHTGQVNFTAPGSASTRALRIDGGPAMADMVMFLKELELALEQSQGGARKQRFVDTVLALGNDYGSAAEIERDLDKWANVIELYNSVNNSTWQGRKVEYGHARLDAFGRIYNRVLQHLINKQQLAVTLAGLRSANGRELLTPAQIDKVLDGVAETIIGDSDFALVLDRLVMPGPDYPDLSRTDMLRVRNAIFNPPNAPVSYPFLWDIAQSDYVQWNGLASNAAAGPLGRNAGEVIGVFGILDWSDEQSLWSRLTGFSLSGVISGQSSKSTKIRFDSSIDLFNLERLESHLRTLTSPGWPFCRERGSGAYYLADAVEVDSLAADARPCRDGDAKYDAALWEQGRQIYADQCQKCHELIDPHDWNRKVIADMSHLKLSGTDTAMASNAVNYRGKAGNFKHTYQTTGVGSVVVAEDAPVVELLTAATRGVVATPDPDKWWPRRSAEWVYSLVRSVADNEIRASIKRGVYKPDTTANPYDSLLAYKARSLNGIWATAPYLHNGSVPNLYEMLLSKRRPGDVEGGRCDKYRKDSFMVGSREFDPVTVGFRSEGYDGFEFRTDLRGNYNKGHEYGVCDMTDAGRWALIEYLKSL